MKYGPIIVETGGKIFGDVKKYFRNASKEDGKHKNISLEQGEKRVKLLEQNELEQAELIDKIADQINELSNPTEIISNKNTACTIYFIVIRSSARLFYLS